MTLPEAVRSGDRRLALEAVRDHLASELIEAPSASVAPIAKQLAAVVRELASLPVKEASTVDQLARRREKRRADTNPPQRAAGSDLGGPGGG